MTSERHSERTYLSYENNLAASSFILGEDETGFSVPSILDDSLRTSPHEPFNLQDATLMRQDSRTDHHPLVSTEAIVKPGFNYCLKQPTSDDWCRWRSSVLQWYRQEGAPDIVRRLRGAGYNVT